MIRLIKATHLQEAKSLAGKLIIHIYLNITP
jgi:hypothetical protein